MFEKYIYIYISLYNNTYCVTHFKEYEKTFLTKSLSLIFFPSIGLINLSCFTYQSFNYNEFEVIIYHVLQCNGH